jgi:hypothetical protein
LVTHGVRRGRGALDVGTLGFQRYGSLSLGATDLPTMVGSSAMLFP